MIAVKLAKTGFIALFLFSRHIGGNIFVIVRYYNNLHVRRPALDRLIDIFFTNKGRHVITSLIIPYPIASHFYAVLVIMVIRISVVPFIKS